MRQMESQGKQKKAAFSVGYNKNHEFNLKHQTWEKKLKKGISQLDKETRRVVHGMSKEFSRVLHEQLQEFAMILTKKYHYSFPV